MDNEEKRAYQRRWAAAKGEHRTAQIREARRRGVRDRIERLDALKANQPCTDCGRTFPAVAMDYDHAPQTKSYGISEMIRGGWKWERILEEIAKCELVCATCHRVRTASRLQSPTG